MVEQVAVHFGLEFGHKAFDRGARQLWRLAKATLDDPATYELMGRGDAELGSILIRAFFHTLGEVDPVPDTIIFLNTGVRLACEGSVVRDDLRALEADGIEMLACGTCLGYFELKEKLAVGQVSNMYDIAETMLRAGKIVHL